MDKIKASTIRFAAAVELSARGAAILDGAPDRVYRQRALVIRDCNGPVVAFGEETSHGAA